MNKKKKTEFFPQEKKKKKQTDQSPVQWISHLPNQSDDFFRSKTDGVKSTNYQTQKGYPANQAPPSLTHSLNPTQPNHKGHAVRTN